MGWDIEELFKLLRAEKANEDIQELPKDFAKEIPEQLERWKDDYDYVDNVKKMVTDIYDIRIRKIMDVAINKAKIKDIIIDESKLSEEEKKLLYELKDKLTKYREESKTVFNGGK